MTTKEHPHAEVLRAIADGVPVEEFEVSCIDAKDGWCNMKFAQMRDWLLADPTEWQVRRKPQYIMVNSFKVPKPLDSSIAPNSLGTVFWPYLTYESLWDSAVSPRNSEAQLAVQRGCAHETKEAAIAHAKAMLGIDPEYFK